MIKRYSNRELEILFSDSEKYRNWLRIEESVLKFFSTKGLLSDTNIRHMMDEIVIIPSKIRELEKTTKHDVVAFINHISRTTTQPTKKWIHYGLTSSDLVDTGNSLALKKSNDLIIRKIYSFLSRLKRLAFLHKFTYCLNRESGLHIKGLTTFGCKLAEFYEDIDEATSEFEGHRKYVECVSISGSMGIFSHIEPELQDFVAQDLDLYSATCSTQVLSRDRYSKYFYLLNRIVQSIHRLALMLRLQARTEIGEIWESFHSGQVGSSSMPHKRNPVSLENICGLCRLFSSYCYAASNNTNIWLERDISHSSVDRVVFLDAITTAVQIISKMESILHGLHVDDDRMKKNVKEHEYFIYRPVVFRALVKEFKHVMNEEELSQHLDSIYEASVSGRISFRDSFERTDLFDHLGKEKTDQLFDLRNYVDYVDGFFEKLFLKENKRRYYATIFYEEEAILNAIDTIALKLNNKYSKEVKPVKLLAARESSLIFLSKLLTKLNFPVDLKTFDASKAVLAMKKGKQVNPDMFSIASADVKHRTVIVVDGLIKNETFAKSLRKVVLSHKPKSMVLTSLFVENDKQIAENVDVFGLLIPCSEGVAGFGVDNGEGEFRNLPMIGKLSENFLPIK